MPPVELVACRSPRVIGLRCPAKGRQHRPARIGVGSQRLAHVRNLLGTDRHLVEILQDLHDARECGIGPRRAPGLLGVVLHQRDRLAKQRIALLVGLGRRERFPAGSQHRRILGVQRQEQHVAVAKMVVVTPEPLPPHRPHRLVAHVVVADDVEVRHLQLSDRVGDLLPLARQFGTILRIPFDMVADTQHEIGLQQVDLLHRPLEHAGPMPAGTIADDHEAKRCGVLHQRLGTARHVGRRHQRRRRRSCGRRRTRRDHDGKQRSKHTRYVHAASPGRCNTLRAAACINAR